MTPLHETNIKTIGFLIILLSVKIQIHAVKIKILIFKKFAVCPISKLVAERNIYIIPSKRM